MSELKTVQVPDIGDTDSVEVIEVLVQVGAQLKVDDSLVTVESDKASMEIPSPFAGTVTSMLVKEGDQVSMGSDILVLDVAAAESSASEDSPAEPAETARETIPEAVTGASHEPALQPTTQETDEQCEVLVIGAGPGGYTAAFRAADLGKSVIMVERYPELGGVCLNVGCIPSKALLHTAQIINEVEGMAAHGVTFSKPEIDIDKLRDFKSSVIGQLTGGLKSLSKQRKVSTVHGTASFTSPNSVEVIQEGPDGRAVSSIGFQHAIVAAGSQSIKIPGFPYDDERLMDSTGALELRDIPPRLLVIGGGIIGLEMGCVYAALGSSVTVVELSDSLMPGTDPDLVRPLQKRLAKQFENIFLSSKVTQVESAEAGLIVSFEGGKAPQQDTFDRVLLAVGRVPNGNKLDAAKAGVAVDERGFIKVDGQMRTNVPHIHAIGDVVGQPMLAHKATHEGRVAAEAACGLKSWFDAKTIPSVAYTDPEVAWMGLTETEAKAQNIAYEKGVFPWAASGRSLSIARNEGFTKVLHDPQTGLLLGAGIVGTSAGELIAELVLALEMGADIEDIGLTIHPHPTLSETVGLACEVAEGTVTDIYAPKQKPAK